MAREKKKAPAPAHGIAAAARRAKMERAMHYSDPVWRSLNPLKAAPKMKHKSYFEAVENTDKKTKRLEFEITTAREPPPGFEFIPTGHPELSHECKEQSRDREAMFFIVSNSKDPGKLDHHMNRLGYHFRHSIVEEARKVLKQRGHHEQAAYVHDPGRPEPIPTSQSEIDQEADAVLRDLFPRIPHTDRREIIDHAFKKDGTFNGEIKVGMAKDITLARRVQLAALAHIRHTHTRYDQLLRESDWANARKAVEKPCLDIIVKWRGDEETGRDQLDEILREVIEISDTEESDDESSDADSARIYEPRMQPVSASMASGIPMRSPHGSNQRPAILASPHTSPHHSGLTKAEKRAERRAEKKTVRRTQQRFKRYAAAAEALANTSDRNGHPESRNTPGFVAAPIEVARSQGVAHPSEVYIPRTTDRYPEMQKKPLRHIIGAAAYERTGGPHAWPGTHDPPASHDFIRVPDTQRPKVGPYSAQYTQAPQPPLSPVRLSFQDMLLPSVEARSPISSQGVQFAAQRTREPHHFTEVPRGFSGNIVKPIMPEPSPRPAVPPANADELGAKRRRVTTYFPEDFERPSNPSYVRVAPQSQDEMLRRPQYEHTQDNSRAPPSHETRLVRSEGNRDWPPGHDIPQTREDQHMRNPQPLNHGIYQTNMHVSNNQDYSVDRVTAPLRSRANPVVLDDDRAFEPRRIVYGDPRPQDRPRVIYVDESTGLVRHEPGNIPHANRHSTAGPSPYREVPTRAQPPAALPQGHSRMVTQLSGHAIPYGREVVRVDEPHRATLGAASTRMDRAPFPAVSQQESPRFYATHQYERQERREFVVKHQPGLCQGSDNVIYRQIRPEDAAAHYERASQGSFPIYPAPSSYANMRGSAHRRVDQRGVVYVE
ncbi:hypothetical protein GGS20DRAFT_534723 [Poronia punctata]|nr:hypothetical protein GGS20DRAFT_534723 [Poronia punctata]